VLNIYIWIHLYFIYIHLNIFILYTYIDIFLAYVHVLYVHMLDVYIWIYLYIYSQLHVENVISHRRLVDDGSFQRNVAKETQKTDVYIWIYLYMYSQLHVENVISHRRLVDDGSFQRNVAKETQKTRTSTVENVIASISSRSRCSSFLGLFCHFPLKRAIVHEMTMRD